MRNTLWGMSYMLYTLLKCFRDRRYVPGNFGSFLAVSGEIPAGSAGKILGQSELFGNYSCSDADWIHTQWNAKSRYAPFLLPCYRISASFGTAIAEDSPGTWGNA